MRSRLLLLGLCSALAAAVAQADGGVAVLAAGEAPAGPDGEVTELTHQLRAACRERSLGVLDLAELRARLLGQPSPVRLAELDRAAAAAILDYQAGEYQRSILIWRGVTDELEKLQDGPETYDQWTRAVLRLAHAEGTLNHWAEARAAMEKLLAVEPRFAPDPDEYSPSYRRVFDDVRQRLRGRPLRRLTIASGGRSGAAFVNGKALGPTPVTIALPAGRYRVSGSSGGVRAPPVAVDLRSADREVELDFALAEAVRLEPEPGLALARGGRAEALRRAATALGVGRLVLVTRVQDGGPQLDAAVYDLQQGAVVREGRVRLSGGASAGASLGALASYLLGGQRLAGVAEVTPAPAAFARDRSHPGASEPALSAPLHVPAPEPVASPALDRAAAAAPPAAARASFDAGTPQPTAARERAWAGGTANGARTNATADKGTTRAATPARAALPVETAAAHEVATAPPPPAPTLTATGTPTAAAHLSSTSPPTAPRSTPMTADLSPAPPLAGSPAPAAAAAPAHLPPSLAPTPVAQTPLAKAPPLAPIRSSPPAPWLRPAAWVSGALALGFAGAATWQGLAASSASDRANAMVRSDGLLASGADLARYQQALDDADRARRLAWVSAGSSAVLAAAAGVLGWLSSEAPASP